MSLIFIIPLGLIFAVIWSLMQIQVISSDIYKDVNDINDVFSASSYESWYQRLDFKWLLNGLCILSVIFIFSGILELICFFFTQEKDTGRYRISRTYPRWIVTMLFITISILFLSIYIAYISIILIWSILGAILNPEKFLPIATGSLAIILVMLLIYSRLKLINKTLNEVIDSSINDQLRLTMLNSLKKHSSVANKIISKAESLSNMMFNRAINTFMITNNLHSVEQSVTDEILKGNAGAIADLIHINLGVNHDIALGIVGMLKNDPLIILD